MFTLMAYATARLLASDPTTPTDAVTSAFVNLGAVGALALLLLWFALGAYKDVKAQRDQERQRAERAEAALDTLNREIREQTLPVLVRSAEVLGHVADEQQRRDRDRR